MFYNINAQDNPIRQQSDRNQRNPLQSMLPLRLKRQAALAAKQKQLPNNALNFPKLPHDQQKANIRIAVPQLFKC